MKVFCPNNGGKTDDGDFQISLISCPVMQILLIPIVASTCSVLAKYIPKNLIKILTFSMLFQ